MEEERRLREGEDPESAEEHLGEQPSSRSRSRCRVQLLRASALASCAGLLAAAACRPGRPALEPEAQISRASVSKPQAGWGCSNWNSIKVAPVRQSQDLSECRAECLATIGCTQFSFKARSGCDNREADNSPLGSCVLLGDGCELESNACFDLFPASWTDPIASGPMPGIGCSNWESIASQPIIATADTSVCSSFCNADAECVAFNFKARDDGACSDPNLGQTGSCVLLKEGCIVSPSPCFDLFPRLQPEAKQHAATVFSSASFNGCYRIPAIIRTANGRLLAFAESRPSEVNECSDVNSQQIVVSYSDDFGASWSLAQPVVGLSLSSGVHASNPYPIALKSGKVVLLYARQLPGRTTAAIIGSGVGMVASVDSGETWSEEQTVALSDRMASISLPGPGAGIVVQLPSGAERMLLVLHNGFSTRLNVIVEKNTNGDGIAEVGDMRPQDMYETDDLVAYSDDEGATWTMAAASLSRMDEGAFAALDSGEVMLVMRHQDSPDVGRAVSRSADRGQTWSEVEFNDQLPSEVCQGSILAHKAGLYVSGPVFASDGNWRQLLTVRKSTDGGQSWADHALINIAPSTGYSSLVAGDEDNLGVLFESDEGILFASLKA